MAGASLSGRFRREQFLINTSTQEGTRTALGLHSPEISKAACGSKLSRLLLAGHSMLCPRSSKWHAWGGRPGPKGQDVNMHQTACTCNAACFPQFSWLDSFDLTSSMLSRYSLRLAPTDRVAGFLSFQRSLICCVSSVRLNCRLGAKGELQNAPDLFRSRRRLGSIDHVGLDGRVVGVRVVSDSK